MLFTKIFPRAAALTTLSISPKIVRGISNSAMASIAVPAQSFSLDRNIFNESLYSRLREFWFAGTPLDASSANFVTAKRWFGVGLSPADKLAFDKECQTNFGQAVEAVGIEHLALPPFTSYEDDLARPEEVAGPLINEVREAHAESAQRGAETLMSLVLLLDQMPRNIYRDIKGLPLIYNHYDRMSWTLLRVSMAMSPSVMEQSSYALKPMYLMWLILPLMHSEHQESHEMAMKLITEVQARLAATGEQALTDSWQNTIKSAKQHKDLIDTYGRYPHRNECLGRESTKDEEIYLASGETFGVKQGLKDDGAKPKDEL